jgi:hypothetical protein
LKTRTVEGGSATSAAGGRIGRGAKFPPQFGQTPPSTSSAQAGQKVHSYEQMRASASGGRSTSQHSQLGFKSSTAPA